MTENQLNDLKLLITDNLLANKYLIDLNVEIENSIQELIKETIENYLEKKD